MSDELYSATGRRKNSVARIWMRPGDGKIVVNKQPLENYFGRATLKMIIKQPLQLTEAENKFDIIVNVRGGGNSGQAGAIKHGISRALETINPDWRPVLKRAGFLTRDPRNVERKKYGQKGARARFQFSKR